MLRRQPHAVGVIHAGDVDAFNDGFDLVAEVGEKSQRIMRPFNSSVMGSEWLRPRDGDDARCEMNDMPRGYNDVAGGAI
ncbi:hypothetical protein [Bradyrhizobium sp. URHD0069]|uniref:hypothetical protein n=1 Tax=Bradyrhizobium sp. URHD0069 TaxID=1380355 RepID=UPI0004957BDA|nr:hypothetical protein [Bradyrhizobium sp. URHD0069]